jgi:hypothetical protein
MSAVEIDDYVLDTLMADLVGHDRQPSSFLVYLFLWRRTLGAGEPTATTEPLRSRHRNGPLEARGAGSAAVAEQTAAACPSSERDHGDSGVHGETAVGGRHSEAQS